MIGINLSIQQRFPQLLCVFTTVSTHGAGGYHGFYKLVCVFTAVSTRRAHGDQQFPPVRVCFRNSFHAWSRWIPAVSSRLCVFTIVSTCEAYAYQQFPNVCVFSQLFPQIGFIIANIFHTELKSTHRNELAHRPRRVTTLEPHQQLASALKS